MCHKLWEFSSLRDNVTSTGRGEIRVRVKLSGEWGWRFELPLKSWPLFFLTSPSLCFHPHPEFTLDLISLLPRLCLYHIIWFIWVKYNRGKSEIWSGVKSGLGWKQSEGGVMENKGHDINKGSNRRSYLPITSPSPWFHPNPDFTTTLGNDSYDPKWPFIEPKKDTKSLLTMKC